MFLSTFSSILISRFSQLTGKDVMTALMNCLKSFDDGQSDTSSQVGDYVIPIFVQTDTHAHT